AQYRFQHRGVGDVALDATGLVFDLDREHAVVRRRLGVTQERVENRIAVEARQTAPHDARLAIDQRADAAISNQSEIKTLQWSTVLRAFPATGGAIRGIRRCRLCGRWHWFHLGRP